MTSDKQPRVAREMPAPSPGGRPPVRRPASGAESSRARARAPGAPVSRHVVAGSLPRMIPLLSAIAVLAIAATGHAKTRSAAEYRLEFAGPADCGDEGELEREIQARVPEVTINHTAPTQVLIAIERREAGLHGNLTIRAGAQSTERDIDAIDCPTIVRGIALMVAVYFDQLPEEEPPPPPPLPLPEPKPPEKEPKRSTTTEYREVFREELDTLPTVNRIGLLAGGEARTGAAAVLMTSGQLGAEWRIERPKGWFAPSVRIQGSYGVGPISTNVGAPWDFRLRLVRATGCPVRYIASPTLRWRGCAVFEVGQLDASGAVKIDPGGVVDPPMPVDIARLDAPRLLWIGGGAAITLEFVLGRRLALEVAMTSVVLGKRARFVEASAAGTQLNEVPRASVSLSITALTWLY